MQKRCPSCKIPVEPALDGGCPECGASLDRVLPTNREAIAPDVGAKGLMADIEDALADADVMPAAVAKATVPIPPKLTAAPPPWQQAAPEVRAAATSLAPPAPHAGSSAVAVEPQPFGKYFLLEKIAIGGMAEIFKATYRADLDKTLVIKRILPHLANDEEFVTMLRDEAKLTVHLDHPNVVRVIDFGRQGSDHYLAMEYVQGRNLRQVIQRCRELGATVPIPFALYVTIEICKGLQYAHTRKDPNDQPLGVVHRDVTPANILISYDGRVKIADFGIAKASSRQGGTQAGVIKGKTAYLSPEQIVGSDVVDHRADIFALGVVFWELLVGRKLFTGDHDFEIMNKVLEATFVPPSTANPTIPAKFDLVAKKALDPDRTKRYPDAASMEKDLVNLLGEFTGEVKPQDISKFLHRLFKNELDAEQEASKSIRRRLVDGARIDKAAQDGATLNAPPPASPPIPVAPTPALALALAAPPRSRSLMAVGAAVVVLGAVGVAVFASGALGSLETPPSTTPEEVVRVDPSPSPERTSVVVLDPTDAPSATPAITASPTPVASAPVTPTPTALAIAPTPKPSATPMPTSTAATLATPRPTAGTAAGVAASPKSTATALAVATAKPSATLAPPSPTPTRVAAATPPPTPTPTRVAAASPPPPPPTPTPTTVASSAAATSPHAAALQRGQALIQQGKFEDAVRELKKLVKEDDGFADGHFFLGSAYASMGEYNTACSELRRYVKMAPKGAYAAAAKASLANCP